MNELKRSGAVASIAESGGQVTGMWSYNGGLVWEGKPVDMLDVFATLNVAPEFGSTVRWDFVDGRDFSKTLPATHLR
ncbi:MAG: hypothetical protein WDO15_03940 [Bacteroidota bacterium]